MAVSYNPLWNRRPFSAPSDSTDDNSGSVAGQSYVQVCHRQWRRSSTATDGWRAGQGLPVARVTGFDRDIDEIPPLGPGAIVVCDVRIAEQFRERKPDQCRALADVTVDENFVFFSDLGIGKRPLEDLLVLESATFSDNALPLDVHRSRNVSACTRGCIRLATV